MKKINWVMVLLMAATLWSCGEKKTTEDVSTAAVEAVTVEGETFGATFQPAEVMTYAELMSEVGDSDSLATTVRGTVSEVCQMKGCWMTIIEEGDEEGMMVRFKDYGFFMPKDISGREVVMHGKAFYRVTPVEELRHYAEDAGKSEEEIAAITEPKRELNFLADGVILVDQP